MKEKRERVCEFCSKPILKSEKFVIIGTYKFIDNPIEESFFHWECFIEYWNEMTMRKAKTIVMQMQQKALQLFNNPIVHGLVSQIKGYDQLLDMIALPLNKKEVYIEKIADKINNDRKRKGARGTKRSPKKRNSKMQEM